MHGKHGVPVTFLANIGRSIKILGDSAGIPHFVTESSKVKTMGTKRPSKDSLPVVKKHAGSWTNGLLSSMEDPTLKVEEDEHVIVIKDKYPKAEVHYLILPKENINHLGQVQKHNLPLLRKMEEWGNKMIERHPNHKIRLGFHAVPSMARLHLHVISQDFNSQCLKTKKHWNTFTTSYFLPISTVISELETKGSVSRILSKTAENLLATKLRCHMCSFEPKTMPQLKNHLLSHKQKETMRQN